MLTHIVLEEYCTHIVLDVRAAPVGEKVSAGLVVPRLKVENMVGLVVQKYLYLSNSNFINLIVQAGTDVLQILVCPLIFTTHTIFCRYSWKV